MRTFPSSPVPTPAQPVPTRVGLASRVGLAIAVLVASTTVIGCAGELQNPERFGSGLGGDGGVPRDAWTPRGDAGGGGSGEDSGPPRNLAMEAGAIFAARCAGCHGAASPAAGLDLVTAGIGPRMRDATSRCMSLPFFDADSPEDSYFIQKVSAATPPCGQRMPLGAPLSAEEIETLTLWVEGLVSP